MYATQLDGRSFRWTYTLTDTL